MSLLLTRVLWYRIDDTAVENNLVTYLAPIDITDAVSWNVGKGLDVKNNVLTLSVRNAWGKYVDSTTNLIKFKEEDQIKVYAGYIDDTDKITAAWDTNSTTYPASAYLLGTYYIKQFAVRGGTSGTRIQLTCVDKTYVLFNKVFSQVWRYEDGRNAPYMIKHVVQQSSENPNGDFLIDGVRYEISAEFESDGGYITDTRSDGSEFPIKAIGKAWKPVYEWARDLSDVTSVNADSEIANESYLYGRPFIFWVDEDNKFHWGPPDFDSPTSLVVGTDEIYSVNLQKVIFGTANMIIYNAGEDMNERGIWGYYLDEASNIKGLQMKVVQMLDIARDGLNNDYRDGFNPSTTRETGGDPGSEAGYPFPQYPLDENYPLANCAFVGDFLDDYPLAANIADDSDYNAALRDYCHYQAKERAKNLCLALGSSKWRGTVEVKGAKYVPGTLIKFTDSTTGLYEEELRLVDFKHNITNKGWFTSLTLEKDPETLIS